MHGTEFTRPLGSGILLLMAGMLALAGCNSQSVSGNSQKTSDVTKTETSTQPATSTEGRGAPLNVLAEELKNHK